MKIGAQRVFRDSFLSHTERRQVAPGYCTFCLAAATSQPASQPAHRFRIATAATHTNDCEKGKPLLHSKSHFPHSCENRLPQI